MGDKSVLSVGDKVRVYFDPLTEREYEGEARLKRFVLSDGEYNGRVIEWWYVRFPGEKSDFFRKILVRKEGKKNGRT